jgi:hypothetical protein
MNSFSEATFDWMAAMSLDNSRAQFLATKMQYEECVRQPFIELLNGLTKDFGGTVKVFRPNRDVRFSANKQPYKTNVSGYLSDAGATYYLDLSLDGLMAATGYYQMAKDQLARYRAVLTSDDFVGTGNNLRELFSLTAAEGEGLKTVPRGVPRDPPNADLLRLTSITCSATLPAENVLGADLPGFVTRVWKRAEPLNNWLAVNVGPSQLESWN